MFSGKKPWMKNISLAVIFFFVFQTLFAPSLYAFDTGTGDMHGGTSAGETKSDPNKGNAESSNDPNKNYCSAGQPVSLMTGEETHSKTDLVLPGRGLSLVVTHTYKSQRNFNGRWGYGWFLNYDIKIKTLENDNLLLIDATGRKEEYVRNEAGGYDSPKGFDDTLTENPDGTYTRTLKNGIIYNFDMNGCLSHIADRNGNTLTFAYDDAGKLPINGTSKYFVTQETGVIAYDYKLIKITDTVGREINFSYNDDGRLTKITDPENREFVYEYDVKDNLIKAYNPADSATPLAGRDFYAYEYDADHNLISVTNPNGVKFLENEYNAQDRVVKQTHNGETSTFAYDAENHTATLTRTDGTRIEYELSKKCEGNPNCEDCGDSPTCGNPTKVVRDAGGLALTRTYTYDDDMNMTSETDPRGHVTRYEYDSKGNVTKITDTENNVTAFEYEEKYNQVTKITDALGRETTFEYDDRGNLKQITDALGNQTNFAYDPANGDLLTVTNAHEKPTSFAYDTHGYISSITDALDNSVTMTYDILGNLESVTDQNRNKTEFAYDKKNQLEQIRDALGNIIQFTYDNNGNRKTVTDALNNTTTFDYDDYDRLKTVANALTHATHFDYDVNGNLKTVTDAEENVTTYQYDTWDRLKKVIDALKNETEYAYDANSNLTSIKDAAGNTTTYQYDTLNLLTKTTYPDGSFETYTYNIVGNLVSKTDRQGRMTAYSYDKLNRLRTKSYPGARKRTYPDADQVIYNYDKLSRLTSASNGSNSIAYVYDALNRVTQVTQDSKTVAYEYDSAGNRTKLAYPDGTYISYVYDTLNRLDQIKDVAGQVLADYTYDQVSRRTGVDLLNGTQTAYEYDPINMLTNLTNKVKTSQAMISSFVYDYDKVGNRKSMTTAKGVHSYIYDKIYQLASVDYPTGYPFSDTSYHFDAVANRTTVGTTTYIANELNQYSKVGNVAYAYDGNGNLTGDGTNNYTYDYENRMLQAKTATDTVTFAYDAFGRRTKKSGSAGAVSYFYDGDQVIAEYDGSGNLLRKFVYGTGIDEPIVMDNGGNQYFYHFDGLGSVTEMTDSGGAVVEKYAYNVYGKIQITDVSDTVLSESAIENPYFFTGRRYDADTGLYHYRARYYSAELGRFLQVDPVGYFDSVNLYGYVLNNPILFIDPFGLKYAEQFAGVGAATGAATGAGVAIAGSLVVDAATGGLNIIATPAEVAVGTAIGAAVGAGIGYGIGSAIDLILLMAKPSKPSAKEKSTNFPDWASYYPRGPNENCKDYAKRILREKYGECAKADKTGPGSEYSKIKKACERGGLSS